MHQGFSTFPIQLKLISSHLLVQKSLFLSLLLPLLLSCHSPGVSVLAGHFSSHFCKHSYSITERYSHVHTNDSRFQCSAYHRERRREPSVPTVLHAAWHKDDLFFSSLPSGRDRQHFNWILQEKNFFMQRTERAREKSYPWWFITAKVAFVISSHFWAHGLWTWWGWSVLSFKFWVVKPPGRGWSTPTCWQSTFLSKAWKKKLQKQNLASDFEGRHPHFRGWGFAGGRWFTESYNSWETGYVLHQTRMGQRCSARHRLNLGLIQLSRSTAWSLKGRSVKKNSE